MFHGIQQIDLYMPKTVQSSAHFCNLTVLSLLASVKMLNMPDAVPTDTCDTTMH